MATTYVESDFEPLVIVAEGSEPMVFDPMDIMGRTPTAKKRGLLWGFALIAAGIAVLSMKKGKR